MTTLNYSTANTSSQGNPNKMLKLLAFAENLLTISKTVGIIIHENREIKLLFQDLFQMNFIPVLYILNIINYTFIPVDNTRNTNPDCSRLFRNKIFQEINKNTQGYISPLSSFSFCR